MPPRPLPLPHQLHKRRNDEPTDLEPAFLAIPLVIVLVIGLAVLLILAHRARRKARTSPNPSPDSDPHIQLEGGKGAAEARATPVANATPDATPRLPARRSSPPQLQSEIDAALAAAGGPVGRPHAGRTVVQVLEAGAVPPRVPAAVHRPEADGGGLPGEGAVDGASGGRYRWELVHYPEDAGAGQDV